MMMNILLLNAHSPQNAGDLALMQEMITCLRTAYPGAKLTFTINDQCTVHLPPDATFVGSFMRWLLHIDVNGEWRWRKSLVLVYACWLVAATLLYRLSGRRLLPGRTEWRALMNAYYDADIVVVIAGGHLYARHGFNIAFGWLWLGLALAILMDKPLVMLPQSYGPLPGRLQRALLRWLLHRSAFVSAREYHSIYLLAEIGLRRRVVALPDMAFTSRMADAATVERALQHYPQLFDSRRPVVGLTLMDWYGQNPQFQNQHQYETAVLALIRHIEQAYDARAVIFAQCTGPTPAHDDRRIARRIVRRAAEERLSVVLVDEVLPPDVLKAAYQRLDVLVATRMHSAIFALSAQVPALAIGYLHKSVGIMEMLGLEQYALSIEGIDATTLCAAFDTLWAERAAVRERLAQRIPAMQATLAHLPVLLREHVRPHR